MLYCKSKSLLGDSSQRAVFYRIGRAAWIRLRLRASNEHRFIVRVLRAREMKQAALSLLEMKKPAGFHQQALFVTRQRPTFPLPHSSSIIGLGGLNFRVRDGNGCGPSGNATGNLFTSAEL